MQIAVRATDERHFARAPEIAGVRPRSSGGRLPIFSPFRHVLFATEAGGAGLNPGF